MEKKGTYLLLLALCVSPSLGTEWTPANYPNPSTTEGSKVCRRPAKSFVCDPDNIISTDSANVVSLRSKNLPTSRLHCNLQVVLLELS